MAGFISISSIERFIKHNSHWVGLFGIVFGFTVSLYFYFSSKPNGEISLKFKTVKIVQAGAPIIKILDDHNQQIQQNIFGLETIIWNSGDLTLGEKSDRLRKPLALVLDPGVKILGPVVQDTKNASPTEMDVHAIANANAVQITWRQFDPTDAIKLFVIYAASAESSVSYDGRFVNAHITNISEFKDTYPEKLAWFDELMSIQKFNWENHRTKFLIQGATLVSLIFVLLLGFFVSSGVKMRLMPIVVALMAIYQIILTFDIFNPKAPF